METWKKVVGFEGQYEVSDLGNVRSIDRIERFRGSTRIRKGIIMKQRLVGKYYSVGLKDSPRYKSAFVHRLVAESFIGDVNGRVVDHIDFNSSNNRLDNLQILTQAENIGRNVEYGKHNYGESHGGSKLTNDGVKSLRNANKGEIAELCKSLNISYSTAKRIRSGRLWKHI